MLKGISNLLKEIVDFHRFFSRIPKRQKRIVFYSEHEGYYPNFKGLIEKLTKKYKQTICYVTSDPNDPLLEKKDPKIKTFYINKLIIFFMTSVECKAFVMTLTDLNQLHIKRSLKPVHYIYVFHSLVSTHMIYRYGAFDYYDSLLCCGPYHIKEIHKHEKLNKLPKKKLIQAGYYRLERIYDKYKKYSKEKKLSSKKGIKGIILVAPSWGPSNILETGGEQIVELLLKTGYEVILRPHPEILKRSPALIKLFDTRFGNNPNFTLETSVATDDSLFEADVLISDYSGISFEYAFGTERPVLFLDIPPKIRNKKFNELGIEPLEISIRSEIGIIVSPKKLETIPEMISKLMSNKGAYKKRITKLRKKYVYNFGHSSEIGAKYILDVAMGKTPK